MKRNTALLATLAVLTALSAASAQEAGMTNPAGAAAACRAYEHVDGQLAFIKAELKIAAAQEPQWNVFATAFRADKEKQAQLCRSAQEQNKAMMSASLPESMKMKAERLSEQLESLRTLEAAVQALYSILGRDQKKVADEIMKGSA